MKTDLDQQLKSALGSFGSQDKCRDPVRVAALSHRFKENGSISKYDLLTLLEVSNRFNLETGASLDYALFDRVKPMMQKLREDMIKDYACATTLELSLVDVIILAYSRILFQSEVIKDIMGHDALTIQDQKSLAVVSKDLDRANRQYLGAFQTLLRLKSRPVSMQVNVNTAYIGQNQVVNQGA